MPGAGFSKGQTKTRIKGGGMRLSEAILLGSMTARAIAYSRHDDNGGACALGMAENARGCSGFDAAENAYPWLRHHAQAPCGHKGHRQLSGPLRVPYYVPIGNYSSVIAHIFNEHVCEDKTWTLEQLVDWIRSVEPQDSPDTTIESNAAQELVTK